MKKCGKTFAVIWTTVMLIAGLTGCNREEPPTSPAESWEKLDVTYNGSTTAETFLMGLDGKAVTAAEITLLTDKNSKQTAVLDESNFERAECDGFAYAYVPSVYYDKETNPEMFNLNNMFIGDEIKSTEFMRVKVGDKFGGLTVRSTRAVFRANDTNGEYYEGSEIEFDGEITLTGTLEMPDVPLDAPYPDAEVPIRLDVTKETTFPLAVEFISENGEFYHRFEDYHVYTDIPNIWLGKFSEYNNVDFGGLSWCDSAAAEVTVDNVSMCCGIWGSPSGISANILNIKIL